MPLNLHSFPTRRSSDLTNLASHFFDLVIGKILTSRLSLSKHLAHNLGNLLLLGKIGVFHNRRNASSRLLLLISKHLILCIYLVFRSEERFSRNAETDLVCRLLLEQKPLTAVNSAADQVNPPELGMLGH